MNNAILDIDLSIYYCNSLDYLYYQRNYFRKIFIHHLFMIYHNTKILKSSATIIFIIKHKYHY